MVPGHNAFTLGLFNLTNFYGSLNLNGVVNYNGFPNFIVLLKSEIVISIKSWFL